MLTSGLQQAHIHMHTHTCTSTHTHMHAHECIYVNKEIQKPKTLRCAFLLQEAKLESCLKQSLGHSGIGRFHLI